MGRIFVEGLEKRYKRYRHRWQRLIEWGTGGQKLFYEPLWVLRGISFLIEPGESVGIIGQNGAGKSTLLKILTGTTQPTQGRVEVEGRVAALLELGLGFHPDFTGRQNAFMYGLLMGIPTNQIDNLMPDIVNFSELVDFMDQPLRTYSSGMSVRLAFSIATAIRPDILIVDEALSVGDAYFQHKCIKRIREFREQGTTLLFVSHDPGAVKTLCNRAILLDKGLMIMDDAPPDRVLDYYNAVIAKQEADYLIRQGRGNDNKKIITRSGDGTAKTIKVQIKQNGEPVNALQVGDKIEIFVEIEFIKNTENPTVGILFKDRLGNEVFGTNTFHLDYYLGKCMSGTRKYLKFEMVLNFGVGNYSLSVAVVRHGPSHLAGNFDWWDHAATLQVIQGKEKPFVGVCYLPVRCHEVTGHTCM